MNRKLAGWLVLAGFIGTVGHTLTMYFAHELGLARINIAGILGSPLFSDWTPPFLAANWLAGMAFHFALGVVFFPLAYAIIMKKHLEKTTVVTGMLWGWAVWAAGQFIFMPSVGMFDYFMSNPTAMLTYFLGHTAYGALFGATLSLHTRNINKRSDIVEPKRVESGISS